MESSMAYDQNKDQTKIPHRISIQIISMPS